MGLRVILQEQRLWVLHRSPEVRRIMSEILPGRKPWLGFAERTRESSTKLEKERIEIVIDR